MTTTLLAHAPPFGSKPRLQLAVGLAGFVPVSAGLAGVLMGAGMVHADAGVSLDSHFRYLSGLLLGIGLLFWSFIPAIEKRGQMIRALTLVVFIGGLARLLGAFEMGLPSSSMRFALIMELVVTPALCLWQMRVARLMDASAGRR